MCESPTTQSFTELLDTASHKPNTLFSLLSKYRVIVPGIQRHYVQGDDTGKAKEVRTTFIRDIFRKMHDGQPLCLDFIYGPIETAGTDAFVPVDGQQRLTTLWLLARYFAEFLNKPSRGVVLSLLGRFTYEDRIHANRFCQAFITDDAIFKCTDNTPPSVAIKKSTWFNPYWTTDSTVAGMLNTLDTIASVAQEPSHQTSDPHSFLDYMCKHLTFRLCVEQFADDIYMKMNGRGLTLTQWENFKGRYSELVNTANVNWERRIEALSNAYYAIVKELPDNAFFAYMARIVAYEASMMKSDVTDCQSITALAKHTDWSKDLPHVPFEEFRKLIDQTGHDGAANITRSFLAMLEYVAQTSHAIHYTPYWQVERQLIQALCEPKNRNELDFSLCAYEYFKSFQSPPQWDAFTLALRLMWNILENVSIDKNPYNRVTGIRQLIKKAFEQKKCESLYHEEMTLGEDAVQYAEESAKGCVYVRQGREDIALLQNVEMSMHGRIRLGLLNLNEKNAPAFNRERLTVLRELFKLYDAPENRRHLVLMVVAAAPYRLEGNIALNIDDSDNLRKLLTTQNDKWLQPSLLDFLCRQQTIMETSCAEILAANQSTVRETQWWERDWRESLLRIGNRETGYEVYEEQQFWRRTVQWHNSGHFYLYSGATIRHALPINDYRIELMRPENKLYTGLGQNFRSIEMNDYDTHSGQLKPDEEKADETEALRSIYFYPGHVEVRTWDRVEGKVIEPAVRIGIDKGMPYSVSQLLNDLCDNLQLSH